VHVNIPHPPFSPGHDRTAKELECPGEGLLRRRKIWKKIILTLIMKEFVVKGLDVR